MWLCHDNEVRATEACLSDWAIAYGPLHQPSFIKIMIVSSLPLSLFSLSVRLSRFPAPSFAFLPFQLFINVWWMLLSRKVPVESFSVGVMKSQSPHPSRTTFLPVREFLVQVVCHMSTPYVLPARTPVTLFTTSTVKLLNEGSWEVDVDWHHYNVSVFPSLHQQSQECNQPPLVSLLPESVKRWLETQGCT